MISINEAKRLIKRALLANIVCDKPNLPLLRLCPASTVSASLL